MKVFTKKDIRLMALGEGKVFSKRQLKLREDVDANIGTASGIQQAQAKAKQLMNQNPSVDSASADAGKLDGQQDTSSGEGMELEIPVNANGQQLATASKLAKDQSSDDVQIKFTKNSTSSSSNMTDESRIIKMRESSVPFTKQELSAFLNTL